MLAAMGPIELVFSGSSTDAILGRFAATGTKTAFHEIPAVL